VKLASALDQPQDSCLDDGSGRRIALDLVQTGSAPKNLLFGPALLHFDDIGARGVLMIMTVTAS